MHSYWALITIYLTSLSLGLITAVILAIFYYIHYAKGLPPGPIGVPFLGYWPFISPKNYQRQFDQLTRKYGDIFSFWCTGTLYIHLGSTRIIREAHISMADCFTKKTEKFSLFNSTIPDSPFIMHGDSWKVNRKFVVQVMRDRMAKSLKGSVYEYVQSAVDELKAKRDDSVNMMEFLIAKSIDILHETLFSEIDRQAIGEIVGCYAQTTSSLTSRNLLATGNIARYIIFPLTAGYKTRVKNIRRIRNILFEIINENKRTYNEDNIRGIFDEYVKERRTRYRNGDKTALFFTDKMLVSTLLQVIGDGVVLTAAFVCHFIESLLVHPEEQEKIYEELMEVVGTDRQPDIEDKNRLTYTNAFIQEVQRTTHLSSFYPGLECTKETTLRGYRIPKGAITVPNVFSAHRDPKYFVNPQEFNPSRFIVTKGKRNYDPLVQFGVGKRSCVGESYVMLQLFLLFTTLVKNIRFLPPEEMHSNSSQLLQRRRLRVRVLPRN